MTRKELLRSAIQFVTFENVMLGVEVVTITVLGTDLLF